MTENTPGRWQMCMACNGMGEEWIPGTAVTHTPVSEPWAGPDYCLECSSAAQDWVRWPCKGASE